MDAGSWMEAFERASERLVEDWQVKLVTTGLLAEGVFPVELISLFALAASEMLSIVENLNDAGVGVLSGLVRKMKRK